MRKPKKIASACCVIWINAKPGGRLAPRVQSECIATISPRRIREISRREFLPRPPRPVSLTKPVATGRNCSATSSSPALSLARSRAAVSERATSASVACGRWRVTSAGSSCSPH